MRRLHTHRPVVLRGNLGISGNFYALLREVALVLRNDPGALIGHERLDPEKDLPVRALHAKAALRIDHVPGIRDIDDRDRVCGGYLDGLWQAGRRAQREATQTGEARE